MSKPSKQFRWEQGRWVHTELLPSLENLTKRAVAMACWFHASGEQIQFNCSAGQLGAELGLSERQVKRTLKRLKEGGVIRVVWEGRGRGNPSTRQFTGKLFEIENKGEKVSSVSPIGDTTHPEKGDMQGRKRCHTGSEKVSPVSPTQKQNKGTSLSLRDAPPFADKKSKPEAALHEGVA